MTKHLITAGSCAAAAAFLMLGGASRAETSVSAQGFLEAIAPARATIPPGAARELLRIAARLDTGKGRGTTMQAAVSTETCCNAWKGFNLTGVLSVAPTNTSGNIACANCAAGLDPLNIGMNFPQGIASVGNAWSTTMTFHSTIPGACKAGFVWVNVATRRPIAGLASDIADCGANNVWVWEFYDFIVPNVPGDTVAVGVISASNGVSDVDYEQFRIE